MIALAFFIGWFGTTVLLSTVPWVQRPRLAERLRPYVPATGTRRVPINAARSIREVLLPLASDFGSFLAAKLGVNDELAVRLERVHAEEPSAEFRLRQVHFAVVATIGSSIALVALGVNVSTFVLFVWTAPLLGFLWPEHRLGQQSTKHQNLVRLELPVIAEQIAMFIDAGLSRSGALQRIAEGSNGTIAKDLRRVLLRIGQGRHENDALSEWGRVTNVDSLDRIIAVLQFDQASDLGRLIADEARVCREEAHRSLLESIERKAQAVWIPVTVAALVPGVIFLSVPFIRALTVFGS